MSMVVATVVAYLLHECGHIMAALYFKVPLRRVGLCRKGVYVQRARTTGWPEVVICLAGPAVNLVLALLPGPAGLCNLVIGVVNLLPIKNSDGTHALEILCHSK